MHFAARPLCNGRRCSHWGADKSQIILRLQEIWQSWFARASAVGTAQQRVDPRQCLDEALLRGETVVPLSADRLAFLSPLRMGYAPAPLTFVCNRCRLFRRFESAHKLTANLAQMRKTRCTAPGATGPCQWRQVDVVFVHWSGEWMPVTPGRSNGTTGTAPCGSMVRSARYAAVATSSSILTRRVSSVALLLRQPCVRPQGVG